MEPRSLLWSLYFNPMKKLKIILVDDHRLVRDGIKSLLSHTVDLEIVGEASDGIELFEKLHSLRPDIVIMDISLPGRSGIEITKQICREYPEIKVLILSMYNSEDFIFNSIKAGAKGYLPKNTTRNELLEAIYAIEKEMRLSELTQSIDDITGNYFSDKPYKKDQSGRPPLVPVG